MGKPGIHMEKNGKIALVIINRPEKKNAFDAAMFDDLEKTAQDLEKDLPRAVVITGKDPEAFSAGFDVSLDNPMTRDFLEAVNAKDKSLAQKVINRLRRAVDRFVNLPVPLIAAINGLAYGGGAELAVRCDLRVIDIKAEICFSEVRLGLMPDWGGGPALAGLIGTSRASDLILTARTLTAKAAFEIGLVNHVSEHGACLDHAMDIARQISQNGPNAVRHTLDLLRQTRDLPLSQALAKEAEAASDLIVSGECLHGITALMEKRQPEFPDI